MRDGSRRRGRRSERNWKRIDQRLSVLQIRWREVTVPLVLTESLYLCLSLACNFILLLSLSFFFPTDKQFILITIPNRLHLACHALACPRSRPSPQVMAACVRQCAVISDVIENRWSPRCVWQPIWMCCFREGHRQRERDRRTGKAAVRCIGKRVKSGSVSIWPCCNWEGYSIDTEHLCLSGLLLSPSNQLVSTFQTWTG